MTYEVKKARVIPSASASMKTPTADKVIAEWSGTCPKCNHVPPPAPTRLCVMHEAREQAIRDCIAVMGEVSYIYRDNTLKRYLSNDEIITALCAMLEKP